MDAQADELTASPPLATAQLLEAARALAAALDRLAARDASHAVPRAVAWTLVDLLDGDQDEPAAGLEHAHRATEG